MTPDQSPASSAPAIATSNTPAPPPPLGSGDSQTLNKPGGFFGPHISGIANWCGLHPADVALGIAGVLGNIAGPYAGLVDVNGGRVNPHLSLLFSGPSSPRWQMLENRLFQPLRKRTDWLRQRASSQSRKLSDRFVFGDYESLIDKKVKESPLIWLRDFSVEHEKKQHLTITGSGLPRNQFDENELMSQFFYHGRDGDPVRHSPGVSHLPSFVFERIALSKISAALNESIHRDAFVVAPTGGIFAGHEPRAPKHDDQAHELAALMEGRDTRFEPLHRDQGYGTFEHAKVHLWATIPLERIGETLHDDKSVWRQLYKQCLLCAPSEWKPSDARQYNVAQAWRRFDQNVQDVMERRCFGGIQHQARLGMDPQEESRYWHLQNLYLERLGEYTGPDPGCTAQFHDLPGRLLWTFKQFYTKGEPGWTLNAAFNVACYAVKQHGHLLKLAHEKYTALLALRAIEQVTHILQSKGPLKLRDIQRSCNNRTAGYFKPALSLMQQEGRLRIDAEKRLHLIAQS